MFIWSCIEKLSFLKINWVPSYTEICLIKVRMVASCGFMGSSLILRKTSKSSKKGNGQDRDEDLVSVWLFSGFFFSDRSFPSSTDQTNKSARFSGFSPNVVFLLRMIYILWVFQWLCFPLVDFYIFGFFSAPKSRAGKKGMVSESLTRKVLCCAASSSE